MTCGKKSGLLDITLFRTWTYSAIECYERGGICDGCPIGKTISEPCMMKYSVIELVKNIGRPKNEEEKIFQGMTEYEEKIVDAILNGCKTKSEIACELNARTSYIQFHLNGLYELAEMNGAVFTKLKFKLPELIEFIKKRAKEKGLYE